VTTVKDQHRGIEGDGWFWPLDSDRTRAVPGSLVATVDSPIELVLLQPMLNTEDEWLWGSDVGAAAPAAHGYVGGTAVTLLNLRITGMKQTGSNPLATRETISANTAAIGAHLPVIGRRDGSAGFDADAVVAELELLDEWTGRPGLAISMEQSQGASRFSAATVRYEYPETPSAQVRGGRIELQGEWILPSYDHEVVGIPSSTLLRVVSDPAVDIDKPMGHVASLQLLLSLVTASAPDVCNFRLHHPEERSVGNQGQFLYSPVTLVVPWARRRPGRHAGPLTSRFSKHRLALLTFGEIGGIEGLARWVNLATDLAVVLSMLTSAAFVADLPLENKFLNVCSAAEGLHRHWHPTTDEAEAAARIRRDAIIGHVDSSDDKQLLKKALRHAHEPSLAERLRALASEVPATAAAVTGNEVRQWSDATAWTRNQLSHPNAPGDIKKREEAGLHPASGLDYIALAHATYWITTAALLRKLGVADELLAARIDDHELSWGNDQARGSIRRWHTTSNGAGFNKS
jgi:hypothetical protein